MPNREGMGSTFRDFGITRSWIQIHSLPIHCETGIGFFQRLILVNDCAHTVQAGLSLWQQEGKEVYIEVACFSDWEVGDGLKNTSIH